MFLQVIIVRSMKTLRPYQEAADKSLFKYLLTQGSGHPLVVAPVGAGKSLMIAELIKRLHGMYSRVRVVVLTHVKELLVQNAEELMGQFPGCDFGFYCAGLGEKKLYNDVTFASIQSIHNKIHDFNRPPEIIIIDECHLISHKAETRYRKFIDAALLVNPNCKVIGYTGTPFRADTGRLDEGKGKLFDEVAYEIGMEFMIEEGYWAKPVATNVNTNMDVSDVAVRGGDYVAGELEKKINTVELNDACVKELIEKGVNRRKWLVFTAGVQHAHDVAEEIQKAGVPVGVVTGDTPPEERSALIEQFRTGELRCIVNVAVLTTGFNVPDIDLLCFMRPTRSPVLYIQTTGRGVRPVYADGYDLLTKEGRLAAIAASPKEDCLILDFGGVVKTLGPIDQVSIRKTYNGEKEREGEGEAVMKICPACGAECAGAQRYCYSCSYCFIELSDKAGEDAVVSVDIEPQWVKVLGMMTSRHEKEGKIPSMKVTYSTMQGAYREWICFEHKGFARQKAEAWHNMTAYRLPVPDTVDKALEIEYKQPSRIKVKKEGKYWRILDYEWKTDEQLEELDIEW